MANFKLGFIGAGFIANFQAKAVAQIRGVDIAGVYSLKGAEEFVANVKALDVGDCTIYNSIDELCRNEDAVAIFAPN